jgi:hypothetical protein
LFRIKEVDFGSNSGVVADSPIIKSNVESPDIKVEGVCSGTKAFGEGPGILKIIGQLENVADKLLAW